MLALAPLTLAVFGNVSLVGPRVNLLAIPVVSFVFVPLVLAGALASWLLPAADGACDAAAATLYEWLWPALVWAADLDFSQWRVAAPQWWYVLAACAALLLLRRWPAALRVTTVAALLPLTWVTRPPASGALQVSVLDAGRGSAVLLMPTLTCCCSTPATAGTCTARGSRAWCCRRWTPSRCSASTCWCFRR